MKTRLSTLWLFATLNYLYADVIALFDKPIAVNLSQMALLGSAILVETPIAMVLLSRVLNYRANRWANIMVAAINTAAVLISLLVVKPTLYYMFFEPIEVACTVLIIWLAWKWPNPHEQLVRWHE